MPSKLPGAAKFIHRASSKILQKLKKKKKLQYLDGHGLQSTGLDVGN